MPRTPPSVARILADLKRALDELGVPWFVFGAQALALRGLPRATADLDVTVLLGERSTTELIAVLVRRHFRLRFGDEDFIRQTRVVPVAYEPGGFPVDVVLGGPGLEQMFLEGSERLRIGRLAVPVASATHLLVMKVLAGRPKDLEDAAWLLGAGRGLVDLAAAERLLDEIGSAIGDDQAARRLVELRDRRG